MLDLFRFLSKLSQDLEIMFQEFIQLLTVEQEQRMWIMQFLQQVSVVKMERNIGILKTHGEQDGEIMDISKWKEMPICVQLLNAIHIPLLIA